MNKETVLIRQHLPRLKKPPLNKETAALVLNTCASIMDNLKSNYWLSAGTLLGLYRDGDFITGDYDIDMEITGNYWEVIAELDKIAPRYRSMWHKESHVRLQAMWLFPDNTLFDLFIYRPDRRGLVSYTPYSDQEIIYPPDLKRTTIEFKGREYPCWEPERYLRYVYGEDWRTPSNRKSVYGNC